MTTRRRRGGWALGLSIMAVVIALLVWGVPWLIQQSGAYLVAADFVRRDVTVAQRLGPVRKVSIKPFAYALKESGGKGSASMELVVEGEREEAVVFVQLSKRGVWELVQARLLRPGEAPVELR